jgi:hypothetical protein
MKNSLRKLAFGLVSIVMGLGVSSAFGEVQNISGTWKLSVEKSGYGNRPKPKSTLLSIEHREPALKYSVTGFDTEGKPFRSAFAGAIDGKEYLTTGNRNVGKEKYRRIHASLVQGVWTSSDGNTVETYTVAISKDGKQMTRKGTLKGPEGEFQTLEVYDRL